jgi:hypothetical protein
MVGFVGFCIIGEINKSLFQFFSKKYFLIFLWFVITFLFKKKIKKIYLKKTQNNDLFISPTNKSQHVDFFLVK